MSVKRKDSPSSSDDVVSFAKLRRLSSPPVTPPRRDVVQPGPSSTNSSPLSSLSSSSGPSTPGSSSSRDYGTLRARRNEDVVVPINPNLHLTLRDGKYACPNPNCSKTYKQENGLKYHLTKGSCSSGPSKRIEEVKALLKERGERSSGSPGTITAKELHEIEMEAEKRLRPFACAVPGCDRRYKNANGLRYHYVNSGMHKKEAPQVSNTMVASLSVPAARARPQIFYRAPVLSPPAIMTKARGGRGARYDREDSPLTDLSSEDDSSSSGSSSAFLRSAPSSRTSYGSKDGTNVDKGDDDEDMEVDHKPNVKLPWIGQNDFCMLSPWAQRWPSLGPMPEDSEAFILRSSDIRIVG